MALLPSIPTSFVPRTPSVARVKSQSGLGDIFNLLSYVVLFIVFLFAIGVFVYGRILATKQAAENAVLAKAEAGIDPTTVENFVQLQNRLNASKTLLKGHTQFSNFFTVLGNILPGSVRFTSLHITIDNTNVAKVLGDGIAKSFNALAAASAAFASDARIKDVIFSNITINKSGSVSFSITANLDPKIVAYSP